MKEVKAPGEYTSEPSKTVFLAGSIEMGKAIDWQKQICLALESTDYTLLNPRRDDWDPFATQSINNPYFQQQVNWELDGLEHAGIIVFYFDPKTISPITLFELGKVLELKNKKVLVGCPVDYFRKGNVDVVCQRAGVVVHKTLFDLIMQLKSTVYEQIGS